MKVGKNKNKTRKINLVVLTSFHDNFNIITFRINFCLFVYRLRLAAICLVYLNVITCLLSQFSRETYSHKITKDTKSSW